MIKTIIFDYGGVLSINGSLYEFTQEMCKKNDLDFEKSHEFLVSLWRIESTSRNKKIFFKGLSKIFNTTEEELKKELFDFFNFDNELYNYIKNNLKGRYKLVILSNNIRDWFENENKKFKLDETFDIILTSYELELRKPNKEIYEKTIEILNDKYEECIFIDDKIRNIKPAKELGIHCINYIDFNSFKVDLENLLN